jgi:hypothetical protein
MKEGKKAPATSGVLVPSSQSPTYIPPSTTVSPISSQIPYSTPGYYHNKIPAVVIRPHAYPRDKYTPALKLSGLDQPLISIPSNDISSVQTPSVYYQPPFDDATSRNEHQLPPIVVLSTPATTDDDSNLPSATDESHLPPLAYYSSSTEKPLVRDESHLPPIAFYPSSTENPLDYNSVIPLGSSPASSTVKSLSNELLPPKSGSGDDAYDAVVTITSRPRTQYHRYEASTRRTIDYDRNTIDSAESHLAPTYRNHQNNVPLFDRSIYQKTPYYDGVGVTANGFRYFLPRQYHEEVENTRDDSRDGSFGYVDPFGIRRVVYYNAGKNGFIHRKNNRYVGFNSTPYDPRPN